MTEALKCFELFMATFGFPLLMVFFIGLGQYVQELVPLRVPHEYTNRDIATRNIGGALQCLVPFGLIVIYVLWMNGALST